MRRQRTYTSVTVLWVVGLLSTTTVDAQEQRILEAVEAERSPLIETMRELVSIESGSRDLALQNRHRILGMSTFAVYMTTAGFSFFAPPAQKKKKGLDKEERKSGLDPDKKEENRQRKIEKHKKTRTMAIKIVFIII